MNRNPLNKMSLDTDNIVLRRVFAFDSNNQPICNNYVLAMSNSEAKWVDALRNIEAYGTVAGYLPDTITDISERIIDLSNFFMNNLSNQAGQLGFLQTASFNGFSNSVCNDISNIKYRIDLSFNQLNTRIGDIIGGTVFMNDLCNLDASLTQKINNVSNSSVSGISFNALSNYTIDVSNNLRLLSNYTVSNINALNASKVSCNDFNEMLNSINDVSGSVQNVYVYTYGTRLLLSNNINDLSNNISSYKSNINQVVADLSGRIMNESGVTTGQFNSLVNIVNSSNANFNGRIGQLQIYCNAIGSLVTENPQSNTKVIFTKDIGTPISGANVVSLRSLYSNISSLQSNTIDAATVSNISSNVVSNIFGNIQLNSVSNEVQIGNTLVSEGDIYAGNVSLLTLNSDLSNLQTIVSNLQTTGVDYSVVSNISSNSASNVLSNVFGTFTDNGSDVVFDKNLGYKVDANEVITFSSIKDSIASLNSNQNIANFYTSNSSLILKGNSSSITPTNANSMYIKSLRDASANKVLFYDPSTGEVTYNTAPTGNGSGSGLPAATEESSYVYYSATDAQWKVGSNAIRIGYNSGVTSQSIGGIAIGFAAGNTSQSLYSIAIGGSAGTSNQYAYAVAIGHEAGISSQLSNAVAIGSSAGASNQGAYSVAIGDSAGNTSQGNGSVAIGTSAGETNQGSGSIAIGALAGNIGQHSNTIIFNATNANLNSSTSNAFYVKPVRNASATQMLYYDVTSGEISYSNAPATSSPLPTTTTAGAYLYYSGTAWTVGTDNIRLGTNAGQLSQLANSVAIGYQSGQSNQNSNAVAIGYQAGRSSQQTKSIAIGDSAGFTSQGSNSIAIGTNAGYNFQSNNTIILNATGANLNAATPNAFYVKPIREVNSASSDMELMYYNKSTGEITHNANGINIQNNTNLTNSVQMLNLENSNAGTTISLLNANITNNPGNPYEIHIGGDMANSSTNRGGIRMARGNDINNPIHYIQPFASRTGGNGAPLHFSRYNSGVGSTGVVFDLAQAKYGFNTETLTETVNIAGSLSVSTNVLTPKMTSSATPRFYFYTAPDKAVIGGGGVLFRGWPLGTKITDLSGVRGTDNALIENISIDGPSFTKAAWNCPVSGLWQVTLRMPSESETSSQIAVGNYTKLTPICINDSSAVVFIEAGNKLVTTGNRTGTTNNTKSSSLNIGFLSMLLLMEFSLPAGQSIPIGYN